MIAASRRPVAPRWAAGMLMLCLACAGCTSAPDVRTKRTHLATVPKDFSPRSFVMSDDGESYAYVTREHDRFYVVHDGTKGPPFLEVTEPRIAPATRHVFYWGVEDSGGKPKVTLVAGDDAIATSLDKPGQVVFSAKGGHWAAIGGTARRDGETIERGPVVLYRDGQEVGSYSDATQPAFSPDGEHLALLIEDAAGRITLVVDGKEQRTFAAPAVRVSSLSRPNVIGPNLVEMRVAYLADGTLLQVVLDESGWALYQGQRRVSSYKVNVSRAQEVVVLGNGLQYARAVAADTIGTAAAVPMAAWWERLEGAGERWRVVRNGAPVDDVVCVKPWETDPPVLSADGTHVAYGCHRLSPQSTEEAYVVFDGRKFGPYAGAWGVTLAPDGERIAYAAEDDTGERPWRYYVDGQPRPTRYDRVWPPRYNANGRSLFWVAQRGERVVLVVNGAGRASSDAVVWVPTMGPRGDLWWAVQRGQRISRVDVIGQ